MIGPTVKPELVTDSDSTFTKMNSSRAFNNVSSNASNAINLKVKTDPLSNNHQPQQGQQVQQGQQPQPQQRQLKPNNDNHINSNQHKLKFPSLKIEVKIEPNSQQPEHHQRHVQHHPNLNNNHHPNLNNNNHPNLNNNHNLSTTGLVKKKAPVSVYPVDSASKETSSNQSIANIRVKTEPGLEGANTSNSTKIDITESFQFKAPAKRTKKSNSHAISVKQEKNIYNSNTSTTTTIPTATNTNTNTNTSKTTISTTTTTTTIMKNSSDDNHNANTNSNSNKQSKKKKCMWKELGKLKKEKKKERKELKELKKKRKSELYEKNNKRQKLDNDVQHKHSPSIRVPEKHISAKEKLQLHEKILRLQEGKIPIASHTVIVIDQSGSMRSSDIPRHSSRSSAAYYHVAQDLIKARLQNNSAHFNDVVTLIEMSTNSSIDLVINKYPCSWDLYNLFIRKATTNRPRMHGNYIPALRLAAKALRNSPSNAALLLFFLSDGRPSDKVHNAHKEVFTHVIKNLSSTYKERFVFGSFGFANNQNVRYDFKVLKEMTETALLNGSRGSFFKHGLDSESISSAMKTSVTTLTQTRTNLSTFACGNGGNNNNQRQLRSFARDDSGETVPKQEEEHQHNQIKKENVDNDDNDDNDKDVNNDFESEEPGEWHIYKNKTNGLKRLENRIKKNDVYFNTSSMLNENGVGIAIKKKYFGKGAERVVFEMTEIDQLGNHVGKKLCGKVSIYDNKQDDQYKFHIDFSRALQCAGKLSSEFNNLLDRLGLKAIPRIKFIPCFFYDWNASPGKISTILVEERLDLNNLQFTKWNDNKGGVANIPMDPNYHLEEPCNAGESTSNITKEDYVYHRGKFIDFSVENEQSEEWKNYNENLMISKKAYALEYEKNVLDCDVPQAFSHWSHEYTKHNLLICDLQGVFDKEVEQPVYQMTDPAIHSFTKETGRRLRNRTRRFGRSDRGNVGISNFFATHQCNPLCKLLKLTEKN